ncbi:hypothetical protein CBS147339_3018 [Penicillium roqueforti]|uniref:uncharacterized protein n=1 Tax=Penicillium roqueforti TaxID=5082 RepID=UPI00190BC1C3|nr:uncharacterized protein LCP9604111_1799 [Penicillium roqueforti]KAF9251803.1 hypothetical protein LCP9604111_1799 [Penicillium roqueforti]KAI2721256.1 hypothetical protein CBS147318_1871 [Penicillium roqueforti]KAI3081700.1 hypothetical protein CBS147339_3018 [Penicillium roqueforti]KAI3095894.1 hypothetical protein CBS147338_5568 [Penicillium roqueforti]KAI3100082.1 hypothetical protein CBS147333_8548 [Penicillium roqueforti]
MNDLQYHNYGQFWYAIVPSVNRLASSFCPFYSLLQTKSSTLTIRQHLSPNPFFFFRKANGCDARLALPRGTKFVPEAYTALILSQNQKQSLFSLISPAALQAPVLPS